MKSLGESLMTEDPVDPIFERNSVGFLMDLELNEKLRQINTPEIVQLGTVEDKEFQTKFRVLDVEGNTVIVDPDDEIAELIDRRFVKGFSIQDD